MKRYQIRFFYPNPVCNFIVYPWNSSELDELEQNTLSDDDNNDNEMRFMAESFKIFLSKPSFLWKVLSKKKAKNVWLKKLEMNKKAVYWYEWLEMVWVRTCVQSCPQDHCPCPGFELLPDTRLHQFLKNKMIWKK